MGVYYFYANRSKELWFPIDPANFDVKSAGIGQGFGSRALGFLLLNEDRLHSTWGEHPMTGSWSGDRIHVSGDDYDPEFESIRTQWRNIATDVLDMMSIVEPYAFLTAAGESWFTMFVGSEAMTEPIRRRLLKYYRSLRHDFPSEQLDRVVEALRPTTGVHAPQAQTETTTLFLGKLGHDRTGSRAATVRARGAAARCLDRTRHDPRSRGPRRVSIEGVPGQRTGGTADRQADRGRSNRRGLSPTGGGGEAGLRDQSGRCRPDADRERPGGDDRSVERGLLPVHRRMPSRHRRSA